MARHVRAGGALVYTSHQPSALDRDSRVVQLG
jgi:ABC-type transport system involved in cytochrome c biogenesis ATPase subunit